MLGELYNLWKNFDDFFPVVAFEAEKLDSIDTFVMRSRQNTKKIYVHMKAAFCVMSLRLYGIVFFKVW